eukprot:tig00020851_g14707.t1
MSGEALLRDHSTMRADSYGTEGLSDTELRRNQYLVLAFKIIFGTLFVWMTYTVIDTCWTNNLIKEWDYLGSIKWMITTLKDFYTNVFAIYCWVFYKEHGRWYLQLLWLVLLICTGSIGTCAYALIELFKLKPGQPPHAVFFRRPHPASL